MNPVIATPHHYLISIQRGGVSFVAVCKEEISPLFVIEFLHRIVDIFQVQIQFLVNAKVTNVFFLGILFRLYRIDNKRKLCCCI